MIPDLRVVLVRPRDPNNIGAVARAMKNFGFRDLWVVSPFALIWEGVTAAPNALDVLTQARVVTTLADAIADCNLVIGTGDQTRTASGLTPRVLSERLHAASYRVALVFGNEKHGLTNEDLSHCHQCLTIPTQPDCPSMNLGQAAAVCFYELTRDVPVVPPPQSEAATAGTTEAALALALEILQLSGFVLPGNEKVLARRVRAGLMQHALSQHDMTMFCGMLRKTRAALLKTKAE